MTVRTVVMIQAGKAEELAVTTTAMVVLVASRTLMVSVKMRFSRDLQR